MDSAELDALWNFNDPQGSETRFREVGTPEALTQVARALGLQASFTEGHAALDDLGETEEIVRVRSLLERGRLYNSAGDKEKAIDFFERALEAAQQIGAEYYAIDAAHMLAICRNDVDSHTKALELASHAQDPRAKAWDASLLNNFGWMQFENGDLNLALEKFEEAQRLREMRNEGDRARIAKWCVARCLRELGRVDEALEMQYSLISGNDGYVFEEIAECLLLKQNLAAARPYMATAANLLPDDKSLQAKRRAEIGIGSAFADVVGNHIKVVRNVDSPADQVWKYLSTPTGLAAWIGEPKVPGSATGIEILGVGTEFDLWIDGQPTDIVRCAVKDVEESSVIFLWENSTELTLSGGSGTVSLTHNAGGDLAVYAAAWHSALDLLVHVLRGGTRETFTENYDVLLPEYRRLLQQDGI